MKKFFIILVIIIFALFTYPVGYFVLENNRDISDLQNPNPSKSSIKKITNLDLREKIGIYVINLDHSKDRYDYIKQNIEQLNLNTHRISAIYGKNLTEQEIQQKVDLKSYKTFLGKYPNSGTIGCYLSHIKVWEKFLNSPYQYALICEDDISFEVNKLNYVIEQIIKNHRHWDIVNLEPYHRGLPLTLVKFPNKQKLSIYLTEVKHTGAYIINREAVVKLLERSLPIKMPVDHYFSRSWEFPLIFTGIENPRVVSQTFGSSEIAQTKEIVAEKIPLTYKIKKIIFKLQSYVIGFFYNLSIKYANT